MILTEAELKEITDKGYQRVTLGENGGAWNEVCFEGVWPNSATGKDIVITEKTIDNMIKNFYDNVRGLTYRDPVTKLDTGKPTVGWDYKHASEDKAAGWIAELEKRDKELPTGKKVKSLWVKNHAWTPSAQEAIKGGEWLFSSVDFNDFHNSVTGKTYKDVLYGVALTNRPAVKYCAPIQLSESGDNAPGGNEPEHKRGEIKMLNKLRALLAGQGVNLAEGSADDTVEYAACEKIKGLSEIVTLNEKKLSELVDAKAKADKELAEAKVEIAKIETEKKELAEAAINKAKAELLDAAKETYTPAQLADAKHYFNVLLAEGKLETAAQILAEKGITLKKTRLDEGEGEDEDEDGDVDMGKDWDNQSSPVKDKKIMAYMKDKKMDEDDDKAYGKAETAVAKAHNQKYGELKQKKAGGKK